MEAQMVKVNIIVRELGRTKLDYALEFELPEIPKAGDYISIFRPDKPLHSEDIIVRHVWWNLHHSETAVKASEPPKIGAVKDIFVECDQAIGPYSHDQWRRTLEAARDRGVEIETFDVARFSVSEKELKDIADHAASELTPRPAP